MRCYNTEAADKWAQEQDDHEAIQERRTDRMWDMIEAEHIDVMDFLSDRFAGAISDDNAEEKHAALERIFKRAFLSDPDCSDCNLIADLNDLDEYLGDALDD